MRKPLLCRASTSDPRVREPEQTLSSLLLGMEKFLFPFLPAFALCCSPRARSWPYLRGRGCPHSG